MKMVMVLTQVTRVVDMTKHEEEGRYLEVRVAITRV